MGALTFSFIDPAGASHWVEEYYETFERECNPIGRTVNPNLAVVAGFMLHEDSSEAERRGARNFQFFGYALSHFYITGSHVPGDFDLWQDFQRNMPEKYEPSAGIGSPSRVAQNLEALEDAGVDQVVFVQQAGNNRHEHICESLELFAEQVMPAFKERHELRQQSKADRLAPAIERAMQRVPNLPQVERSARSRRLPRPGGQSRLGRTTATSHRWRQYRHRDLRARVTLHCSPGPVVPSNFVTSERRTVRKPIAMRNQVILAFTVTAWSHGFATVPSPDSIAAGLSCAARIRSMSNFGERSKP